MFAFGQTFTSRRKGFPLKVFYTDFVNTENPISQGGSWIQQDPAQTKVQTSSGFAFGTQTGSGAFDDSQAYMTGFGNNYDIEVTLWLKNGIGTSSPPAREVGLLVRASDTTTSGSMTNSAYEISLSFAGEYSNIGRFKGANLAGIGGGFGSIGSIGFVPVTGDKFKVSVRTDGSNNVVITAFHNGTSYLSTTDTDPTLKILTGNPGIDFFIGAGGASNDDFRITDCRITQR